MAATNRLPLIIENSFSGVVPAAIREV